MMLARAPIARLLILSFLGHLSPEIHARSASGPLADYRSISDQSLRQILKFSKSDPILDFNRNGSILSQILIPRPVESQNLTHCRKIFESFFKNLSTIIEYKNAGRVSKVRTWQLESHRFSDQTPYGLKRFESQIFTHDPDDDQSNRRIILAAHIDSKFFPNFPENQFVGATDSATPVAIILQVVKDLTPLLDLQLRADLKNGIKNRVIVQVVLLDGEEAFKNWTEHDSIYGARSLAKQWSLPVNDTRSPRSIDKIKLFILFDLLGSSQPVIKNYFLNTGLIFDGFQKTETKLLNSSAYLGSELDKRLIEPIFVPRSSVLEFSNEGVEDDHLPFLKEGVPILHLISSPFPKVWHTLADARSILELSTIKHLHLITLTSLIEILGLEGFVGQVGKDKGSDDMIEVNITQKNLRETSSGSTMKNISFYLYLFVLLSSSIGCILHLVV